MSETRNPPDSFTLNGPELQELLKKACELDQAGPGRVKRKSNRQQHYHRGVCIKVIQPGGGVTTRAVMSRDLSASGIGIIYPGYLHNGSSVQLILRTRLGKEEIVRGTIVNCRHITSFWHTVGIKFQDSIFTKLYIDAGSSGDGEDEVEVNLSSLKGRVLLIDDQEMDRLLFMHYIEGSGIHVTQCALADEALAMVTQSLVTGDAKPELPVGPFDLIVCDLNLGETQGELLIAKFRKSGYEGQILVMTAETMQSRIAAATIAGANGTVQKPCSDKKLHAAIARALSPGGQGSGEPVFSTLSVEPKHRPLVQKYVDQIRAIAVALNKSMKSDDLTGVRKLCQSIMGTGAGYGFKALTEAATAAITSLDASYSIEESTSYLQRLLELCGRLSAAEPPRRTAARAEVAAFGN